MQVTRLNSRRLLFILFSVLICTSATKAQSEGLWKLDDILVEKTYVGLKPENKTEKLEATVRSFKLGWLIGDKEISANISFAQVPDFIRTTQPYDFSAKIDFNVNPIVASQPDTILRWGFWFAGPMKSRMVGGRVPSNTPLEVSDSRAAYSMASSFGGPPDPRSKPGDFWETLHVRIEFAGAEIWGDMRIQFHYKWMGAPLAAPACNMGNVWSGGPDSKWVRRSGSVFDVINGSEYSPNSKNGTVTLEFKGNSFTGKGRSVGATKEKECTYQGFVNGKEVTLRAVMCTGFSGPIEGGLYIDCDARAQHNEAIDGIPTWTSKRDSYGDTRNIENAFNGSFRRVDLF
jgi:hypothetical protein